MELSTLEGTWEEILQHTAQLAGQRVRVTILTDEPSESATQVDPVALMRLPLAERRQILAAQAAAMVEHYQQEPDWREFTAGDIVDY